MVGPHPTVTMTENFTWVTASKSTLCAIAGSKMCILNISALHSRNKVPVMQNSDQLTPSLSHHLSEGAAAQQGVQVLPQVTSKLCPVHSKLVEGPVASTRLRLLHANKLHDYCHQFYSE